MKCYKPQYEELNQRAFNVVSNLCPSGALEQQRKRIIRNAIETGALCNGSGLHRHYGVAAHKSVLKWLGLDIPISKPTSLNRKAAAVWSKRHIE